MSKKCSFGRYFAKTMPMKKKHTYMTISITPIEILGDTGWDSYYIADRMYHLSIGFVTITNNIIFTLCIEIIPNEKEILGDTTHNLVN